MINNRMISNPLTILLATRNTMCKLEQAIANVTKYNPIASNKCHQLSHFVSDVKAFEATNNSLGLRMHCSKGSVNDSRKVQKHFCVYASRERAESKFHANTTIEASYFLQKYCENTW
jgi:hypothetical protein